MSDTPRDIPRCWDTDFQNYLSQLSAEELQFVTTHGWCTDCTPSYKKQMVEAGRCAFSTTKFYVASVVDLPNARAGVLYLEHRLIGVRPGAELFLIACDGPTQILELKEVEE